MSLSSNVEKICKTNLETTNTADGSVASSSGSNLAVQYSGTADYNDVSSIQPDVAVYDDGAEVYDDGAKTYDINADSIVLKYPDAYAKNIKINTKTGKMESGTWGYDVEIYLDHCGILGIEFNNFHTTIRWKCWYPVVD